MNANLFMKALQSQEKSTLTSPPKALAIYTVASTVVFYCLQKFSVLRAALLPTSVLTDGTYPHT